MQLQKHNIKRIIEQINNSNVYDVVKVTDLVNAVELSKKLGNTILFKREDQQKQYCFKLRGAYQKISQLSAAEKKRGVIAMSAGNHAQGVAYAAKKLNITSTIVMPINAPSIKVDAVKRLGAEVILYGDNVNEAYQHVLTMIAESGAIFIPPYDDWQVIIGQATIAKELLAQHANIDYVFVPVGGGGLISGIAFYLKTLNPNIKVIGVEPESSPTLFSALVQKKPVMLDEVGVFAEGVAVSEIGHIPFEICSQYVDEVVLVNDDEICAAIKDVFENTRSIVEPSAAVALAGCKKYINNQGLKDFNMISILTGANVNFDRLRYIAERAEFGEYKEAIFAVRIAEEVGSFYRFCQTLGNRAITEFNYRFASNNEAYIFVGIALKEGIEEKKHLISALIAQDYFVEDMTDNEMAKTHIRYMVGGRAQVANECLYRFTFPERPGALLKFLEKIAQNWNISLFHYRNHGASFGRVLIGIQAENRAALEKELSKLNYAYVNENDNQAFKCFL